MSLHLSPRISTVEQTAERRWHEAIDRLEGAYNGTTLAGYRRCMLRFSSWCRSHQTSCLPASPQVVAAYLETLSSTLKRPSLGHISTCIGKVHRLADEPDPTKSVEVFLTLRRAARNRPYVPRQALGLTTEMLETISKPCVSGLLGLRDRTLMWVGFETLCRGSEIVALRAEDLLQTPRQKVSIRVRMGKTDPYSRGRTIVLSDRTARIAMSWLRRSGISEGFLLPRLDRVGSPSGSLSVAGVTRILRERAREAGVDEQLIGKISSHSLRVGGAQQLTMNARNLQQIMRAGGWRSIGTVSRYIEGAELSVWDETSDPITLPQPGTAPARGWR